MQVCVPLLRTPPLLVLWRVLLLWMPSAKHVLLLLL
jgi:hypothetical protein